MAVGGGGEVAVGGGGGGGGRPLGGRAGGQLWSGRPPRGLSFAVVFTRKRPRTPSRRQITKQKSGIVPSGSNLIDLRRV